MRLAFFLDNRDIACRGPLSDPSLGNPGIGGTEYAFVAVPRLLAGSSVEPLLLLTAPQLVVGLSASAVLVVSSLPEALQLAATLRAVALVFRPGFASAADWEALESSPCPWLRGCTILVAKNSPDMSSWRLCSVGCLSAARSLIFSDTAV